MKTINPLPEFSNEQVLLDGTFEAVFRACDVTERTKFDDVTKTETALRFYFEVPSEEATVIKIVGLKFGQQSNLWKDLRAMTGPEFSPEVFRNQDTLWEHIEGLMGRAYVITCTPSESGRFTKITGIQPAKRQPSAGRGRLNGPTRRGRALEEINV